MIRFQTSHLGARSEFAIYSIGVPLLTNPITALLIVGCLRELTAMKVLNVLQLRKQTLT